MKAFIVFESRVNGTDSRSRRVAGLFHTKAQAQDFLAQTFQTISSNGLGESFRKEAGDALGWRFNGGLVTYNGERYGFEGDAMSLWYSPSPELSTEEGARCRRSFVIEETEFAVRRPWDFASEEDFFDILGTNRIGLVTDGGDSLYFHVFPSIEKGAELCRVYASFLDFFHSSDDGLLVEYVWTADNDSLLLQTLNALPEGADRKAMGDALKAAEFES